MRQLAIAIMIIVFGMVTAMPMTLRAAAFSYTPRLVSAASADLSWLAPSGGTTSDCFVGDERCAEPYDKRSVRGVISLWERGTSEMLNGCAAGGTSPMYTAWAETLSPRTLRLSWGFTYSPSPMVNFNPYLFGSKEYLTTAGANLLDFTARTYDPTTLLFHTQDPEAIKFTPFNSYLYCASDPINHIDPDGRIVYILGADAEEARAQLQSKVGESVTLSLDDEGKLICTVNNPNKKLISDAEKIAKIIDNEDITVNLNTTKTNITSVGKPFIGGAFMGNEVSIGEDGTVTVVANQEVNPGVLKKMSDAHNKPGANMFHEVTEAYEGALISKTNKTSSPMFGVDGTVYDEAHKNASPQSGDIFYRFLDKDGNELRQTNPLHEPPGTTLLQWYVVGSNSNVVVLKKYPE